MKNKGFKRKYIIPVILTVVALSLTGCAGLTLDKVREVTDNLDTCMQDVIERNLSVINELYNAGLLDTKQKELWESSVREKCASLMDQANKETMEEAGGSGTSNTKAAFKQFEIALVEAAKTTDIPDNKKDSKGAEIANSWSKFKEIAGKLTPYGEKAQALMLFDDASVTSFKNDLNRPVYVLDTSKKTGGVSDATDLKYLQLALAILKNDAKTLNSVMTAEHLSDNTMIASVGTLGELKQNMTNLTADQQSSLERYALSFFKKTDHNLASLDTDDIFVDSKPNTALKLGKTAYENEINYDVVVSADGLAALTIRVHELNKNLIPFISGFTGNIKDGEQGLAGSYYLLKSDKIALKLDYRLETISDIYTGSVDSPGEVSDTNWECKTTPTNFNISIYDGSMVSEDGNKNNLIDSPFTSRSIMVHPSNTVKTQIGYVQRYTTGKSNTEAEEVDSNDIDFKKASTKEIDGDTEYTCFYKKDGTKVYAHYNWSDCPTVVLRDYLEYNYYPNVIGSEKFITTGRFMRVNKLSGTKDDIDTFAESITKNGGSFENPIYISLRDIVDHQSGQGYYEGVNEKLGLGQDNIDSVNDELAKGKDDRKAKLKDTINPGLLDGDGEQDSTQEGLTVEEKIAKKLQFDAYFNWIRPVEIFGTKEDEENGLQGINEDDAQGVKDYSTPTLWGMFTSKSISENLWGSWITADSARESGSLAWFNEWLKTNKYKYVLTEEMLLEAEKNSGETYKQGGAVVVDLNLAAKVQQIQNEKYGFNLERQIRTLSRILGMLIMLYSLVLLGCWVIDINIEGGPGFLRILTFGKWISIRDSSGVPPMPPDGAHYLNFTSLAISVFIMMCLGVTLIALDIIDIRNIVNGYTKNIFKAISDMLFG